MGIVQHGIQGILTVMNVKLGRLKMSESTKRKWTGGEWGVFDWQGQFVVAAEFVASKQTIAQIAIKKSGNKPITLTEQEANAHLLAGSKKLFEALTALSGIGNPPAGEPEHVDYETAMKMTQAALQAALGEGE